MPQRVWQGEGEREREHHSPVNLAEADSRWEGGVVRMRKSSVGFDWERPRKTSNMRRPSYFPLIFALLILAPVTSLQPRPWRSTARRTSPRMSIAIFGASGGVGGEAAFQAMQAGESVSCLVRDPSRLTVPPGSGGADAEKPLTGMSNVVTGSVTNAADVEQVFDGQDVTGVIVALGGKTKDVGETMLTDGTLNIINACKKYGVKRVAVVTSIGAGDSQNQAPLAFKVLMWTVMSKIFKDKNNQEALFLGPQGPGKDLEFCIVRPGGLNLEPPNGIVNVIDGQAGSITRADVAKFCLDAIQMPDFPFIRKAPCISSDGGTSWTKDRTAATQGARAD